MVTGVRGLWEAPWNPDKENEADDQEMEPSEDEGDSDSDFGSSSELETSHSQSDSTVPFESRSSPFLESDHDRSSLSDSSETPKNTTEIQET
ncbi:hypothetical protein BGZ72_003658, partial [Mortierella alpina]